MSEFYQKLNPITGSIEWHMQDELYDYNQEVARSAYADMLHDKERNCMYYDALRAVISAKKLRNQPTHVLDIGAGTGLLSMMAAACGADSVTACEAFLPMAKCAKQIIAENGYANKIRLIAKRSNELTVGSENADMLRKANILVTEVFDTELIGEGALPTFIHAHKNLLEEDCVVIPSEGIMYTQLVESKNVRRWHELQAIPISDSKEICVPQYISDCNGSSSVHDVQLSQISPRHFRALSKPSPTFKFDFSGKTPLKEENSSTKEIEIIQSGEIHAIFMWWELKMDPDGEIILSCAPTWAHPDKDLAQWRDHWMQAIYYPPNPLKVSKGDQIKFHGFHNAYNIWFLLDDMNSEQIMDNHNNPNCDCGSHNVLSRTRIGMLNDETRHRSYLKYMKQVIHPEAVCLCLDDISFLPLIAAKLKAKKVFCTQPRSACKKILESYAEVNGLQNQIKIMDCSPASLTSKDLEEEKIDVVLCEPFYLASLLPWDNIHLWYILSSIRSHLSPSCKIMPQTGSLKIIAVEFQDLWKIRASLGTVEGFSMKSFDQLIMRASAVSDNSVEPQPLWEYPCKALSNATEVFHVDFTKDVPERQLTKHGVLSLEGSGFCNGIALWMDWNLDNDITISTGPVEEIVINEKINWDPYSRQGVYFFGDKSKKFSDDSNVEFSVSFNPETGVIDFKFNLVVENH